MRSLIKNKKGNAIGIIVVLIFIFIIAIVALLVGALSKKFSAEFNERIDLPDNSSAEQAFNRVDEMSVNILDQLVFFIFLGLNVGIIISAAKTKFSPIVIGIFIFLLIFAVIIAAGLTNLYTEFADSTQMSEYSDQMNLTGFVFNRFTPLIICILSGLTMIIMYGKQPGGQGF